MLPVATDAEQHSAHEADHKAEVCIACAGASCMKGPHEDGTLHCVTVSACTAHLQLDASGRPTQLGGRTAVAELHQLCEQVMVVAVGLAAFSCASVCAHDAV